MGLNINTFDENRKRIADYDRLGSYHTIHILRQWVMIHVEGNTKELVDRCYNHFSNNEDSEKAWKELKMEKCPKLLDHSDCDGGYKSFSHYKSVKKSDWLWQDLDALRAELKMLKKDYYKDMDEDTKWVFDTFNKIINKKGPHGEVAVKVEFT
jgi:hypothetical protein